MSEQAVIRTEGLTKHYGRVRALLGLTLDIPAGEVFGFLGPNGAGKTTAIRTLMDEVRPTAGRASILGMDTHRQSVDIRRHIGYLPGDLALYPNLTGRETLTYYANLRGGVDWKHVRALADRLQSDLDKKVGDLSSGNRQKVGIIQAFMKQPQVLILDEPSTGLDPLMQRELQDMMREAAEAGATVFLSSHALSEVERVAHRVGIIRRGRVVAVETIPGLRSRAMRHVDLVLATPAEASVFAAVPGVRDVKVSGNHVTMALHGEAGPLLRAVAGCHTIVDVSTEEADLEEIFLTYYREEETGP